MKNRSRSNVLPVEILIARLFFMLASTVLVRLFATARGLSVRSGVEAEALAEAQNMADVLYTADDLEASLEELGFSGYHGIWTRGYENYTLMVSSDVEYTDVGELRMGEVRGYYGKDEEVFSLPFARYVEVEEP